MSDVRRTPELRLLLSTAACHLSKQARGTLDHLLQQDLDWPTVLQLAAWHRTATLLGSHLSSERYADQVPGEILERLHMFRQRCSLRSRRLRRELEGILQALLSEGIPVIVLKGAALAETIYPEAALRPMRDLDLLVEEQHLERAVDTVHGLGYSSPLSSAVQRRTASSHHHYPELWSRDGTTCLELHRHLVRPAGPLRFEVSDLWSRAREARIAGAQALVLSPQDLLLHLCLKFFEDTCGAYPSHRALGKLVDISETLHHHRDTIRWDQFVHNVLAYRLAGPVACALLTSRELLLNAPPDDVLVQLRREHQTLQDLSPFIEKKVLRAAKSRWYFHQLVEPPDRAGAVNELKSALHRIVASRVELESRYGPKPLSRLFLRHSVEVSWALGCAVARPHDFWLDLKIDRWLYSLMNRSPHHLAPFP